MKKVLRKKAVHKAALIPAATLLVGLAAGSALAYVAEHDNIVLKDPSGGLVTMTGTNNAYSVKTTCFNASCHGSGTSGTLQFGYDSIEKHSYHAQNGTNELRGFNPYNPDATVPEFDKDGVATGAQVADPFRRGVSAKAKSWVQSPGHVGNW